MIEVKYHKSTVLILTDGEFARAVSRGKAKRRREQFETRVAKLEAERKVAKPTAPAHTPRDTSTAV